MKKIQIILFIFISFSAYGQNFPNGKYINDNLNEKNYIIFHTDSTFKYRYAVCLMHDIACGKYRMNNDTIILDYLTDMRDTCCNKEIDGHFHYDSLMAYTRPIKLFYKKEKLYQFDENRKIKSKFVTNIKPPKHTKFHRRYLIFGEFIIDDAYYMITESKVKWRKNKKASR